MVTYRGPSINWCFYDTNPDNLRTVLKKWEGELPWLKAMKTKCGWNTVRLCIASPDTNAAQYYGFDQTDLDAIINLLGVNGFKINIDLHNWKGNQQPNPYGSQYWFDFWIKMSDKYIDNKYVVIYEPMNEPDFYSGIDLTPDMIGTPDGVQGSYGWLISKLRERGDNKLVLLPDPWYWQTGVNGYGYGDPQGWMNNQQILQYRTDVLLNTHNYFNPNDMNSINFDKNRLLGWKAVGKIISGEWGFVDYSSADAFTYAKNWYKFLKSNYVGYFFWMSGYPSEYELAKDKWNIIVGYEKL